MRLIALLGVAACAPAPTDDTDAADAPLTFGFPLLEREMFRDRIGVDHDPTVQPDDLAGRVRCSDYLTRAFPHCYDEHHGTDFMLDGGFPSMDAGSATIVAAADGVVIDADDGHYDRCHASLETGDVTCDGGPIVANYVILHHADGRDTLYWHMMNGSVAVSVGDTVRCGDVLGRVGSSGNSSAPHLHFQVERDGVPEDPYTDPASGVPTSWADQGPDVGLPGDGCTAAVR